MALEEGDKMKKKIILLLSLAALCSLVFLRSYTEKKEVLAEENAPYLENGQFDGMAYEKYCEDNGLTMYGGKRADNAEPYLVTDENGENHEIDYGGYYDEGGRYIIPAEEGYWILENDAGHNPVTGEYWYLVEQTP